MSRPANLIYYPVGFLFPPGHAPIDDPAAYHDLRALVWKKDELELDLALGNLPMGMIIQLKGGLAGVVVPDPGDGGQRIQPLADALHEMQKG